MRERLAKDSRTGPWEQVMLGFLRKIDNPKIEMAKSQSQVLLTEADLNPEIKLYNVRTP